MGNLSAFTLSYGIDVITPVCVARPGSIDIETGLLSRDVREFRCECLEDCDPAALVGVGGVSGTRWPSSFDLSLCRREKKDLPPEDCLGFPSCEVLEGILLLSAQLLEAPCSDCSR